MDVVQVLHHGQTAYLHIWCQGCDERHQIVTSRPDPGVQWDWDGNLESPTIDPSLLVTSTQWEVGGHFHKGSHQVPPGGITRCHSFIRAGQMQFLSDSTHNLAGQTVPMLPVDQWPY